MITTTNNTNIAVWLLHLGVHITSIITCTQLPSTETKSHKRLIKDWIKIFLQLKFSIKVLFYIWNPKGQ